MSQNRVSEIIGNTRICNIDNLLTQGQVDTGSYELTAGKFQAGHVSQLNMYMNIVDDLYAL
ncbi:MAG: hypothetical protein KKD21_07635 [Proteobacteria bacterium]|nr:hypothetical protein [Pseudomonadota bacterium]MBU1696901.1 hypothetical protein [Pseudomonadota bacterium]